MHTPCREFQVFAKPLGADCNLRCAYCYYRAHTDLPSRPMSDDLVETYILQHIEACTEPVIFFSWHGGEPTLAGLDFFQRVVTLQKRHQPTGQRIVNGIQTNGILLDETWCRFLAQEGFTVGLSLDGPQRFHDHFRVTSTGSPTHARVIQTYRCLRAYGIPTECLCVVNTVNGHQPLEVYDFFCDLEVPYLTFLPLVEPLINGRVSERTVPADAWGDFLCAIFDVWLERDIGRIKIQIFEEATRPALGLEHSLCIFRRTCGGVPVLEYNGDLYSCDHFVNPKYLLGNILYQSLVSLLDSAQQKAFGRAKQQTLPKQCQDCEALVMCNGGCPKNRFIKASDGEPGLNYLCPGYKQFFIHCQPFLTTLAYVRRFQSPAGGD